MMQSANGLGLQAVTGIDYCQVTMKFPSDTIPKWVIFSFKCAMYVLILCLF